MKNPPGPMATRTKFARAVWVAAFGVLIAGCDARRSPAPTGAVGGSQIGDEAAPIVAAVPSADPVAPAREASEVEARKTKAVAGALAADGRTFRPSVNGFHFVNSFSGSAAPPALREADGGLLGLIKGATESSVGGNFGLCGGMSASAADYFNAGRTPPSTREVPGDNSVLRNYLFERQVDSLGAMGLMAAKFVERMALADVSALVDGQWTDSAAARTTPELASILMRLDRGELVPLGLVHVRAGRGSAIWENHQVLAYSYERDEGRLTIRVYDPNAPMDDDAVVRLSREADSGGPEQWRGVLEYGRQRDGRARQRPVRTLFAMPYTPKNPPNL